MKIVLFSISILFLFAVNARAETYCQNVNSTGIVVNASPLAQTVNKWLKQKGADYETSPQEVTNTLKNYCRSNPSATVDDATDHLVNIINVTAELLK